MEGAGDDGGEKLTSAEMLRLLSYMEGEVQARDVIITTLRSEKIRRIMHQEKYNRFGNFAADPYSALQRDSEVNQDEVGEDIFMKNVYDNQLQQLDNLISKQKEAQSTMQKKVNMLEKKYQVVSKELEDEKKKHARDTAQGDDVTYALEKDRERLRHELEFERNQTRKLEKEVRALTSVLDEERATAIKHKQVALLLIKERKVLGEHLLKEQAKVKQLEATAIDKSKVNHVVEEKFGKLTRERDEYRERFSREELRSREMKSEVDRLLVQVELLQSQLKSDSPQSIEIRQTVRQNSLGSGRESPASAWTGRESPGAGSPTGHMLRGGSLDHRIGGTTYTDYYNIPVYRRSSSPASDSSKPLLDANVQRALQQLTSSSPSPSSSPLTLPGSALMQRQSYRPYSAGSTSSLSSYEAIVPSDNHGGQHRVTMSPGQRAIIQTPLAKISFQISAQPKDQVHGATTPLSPAASPSITMLSSGKQSPVAVQVGGGQQTVRRIPAGAQSSTSQQQVIRVTSPPPSSMSVSIPIQHITHTPGTVVTNSAGGAVSTTFSHQQQVVRKALLSRICPSLSRICPSLS